MTAVVTDRPPFEQPRQTSAGTLDVSVVVPTYRRDVLLDRCLRALLAQDYPLGSVEILVVDDGQSSTTSGVIERICNEHLEANIWLLNGAGTGPAAARNRGWRAAQGQVIAFIDDDAYPARSDWLLTGCSHFQDPDVVAVSGTVNVPIDRPETDFQRNVMGLERGEFLTCNAFYRRSILEEVGGFDERFTVAYREDSDLHYRVEATGRRLVREPRALVMHPAPRGTFGISLKLQRYSMFNALIYAKHPRQYRERLQARPPLLYYAVLLALSAAGVNLLAGRQQTAMASGLIWLTLTAGFFVKRARGLPHRPMVLADLAVTSILIPPASIYWRLRGAFHFRVFFL